MKHIDPRVAGAVAMVSLGACVAAPQARRSRSPRAEQVVRGFCGRSELVPAICHGADGAPAAAANNQAVGTALLTTALGAGLGAAVGGGGWHGNAGRGAGIGAAGGAVAGTALGAGQAGFAQMSLQQQFDVMYGQCMSPTATRCRGSRRRRARRPIPAQVRPAARLSGSVALWLVARRAGSVALWLAALPGGPERRRHGPSPYGPPPYDLWSRVSKITEVIPGPAFCCRSGRSSFNPRRLASARPQTIACSSVSKRRTIGSIFAVAPGSSHSSTRLASTPTGAGSRMRVSFMGRSSMGKIG